MTHNDDEEEKEDDNINNISLNNTTNGCCHKPHRINDRLNNDNTRKKCPLVPPWQGYKLLLASAPRELWVVYVLKVLESYSYYSMAYILLLYLAEEFGMTDLEAGLCYGEWLESSKS